MAIWENGSRKISSSLIWDKLTITLANRGFNALGWKNGLDLREFDLNMLRIFCELFIPKTNLFLTKTP